MNPNKSKYLAEKGPWVAQWLRRCATSRTVPGSIPGGVTGFFSDVSPSDRSMVLGSTQPLVKMSTRNIPGGKGGRCVRLTTYHHTVPLSRNLGALTSLEPSGPARPVTGVLYLYLYLAEKLCRIRFRHLFFQFFERLTVPLTSKLCPLLSLSFHSISV